MSKKASLTGESWMSYTTHVKGFDSFYTPVYETGEKWLKTALEEGGYEATFIPNHLAGEESPLTMEELEKYDVAILSDTGVNTLLLPSATFMGSEEKPNRCNLIRDYVLDGGAPMMVGDYLIFSGVDAKGKWHDTAVQQVLPVEVPTVDDRMEHCEGTTPVTVAEYEALNGVPREFPKVLGYNKTIAKPEAVMATVVDDGPFTVFGVYGKGKSAAVATDYASHWAPSEFCEWKYYNRMWQGIMDWPTK